MKYLISVFMLCFALSAHALDSRTVNSAGFDNLSEQQKAEIVKLVADKAAFNANGGVANPDKIDKWMNIGERIGKGFGAAARELGVAVNDFAKTPVGQMTMFLIVWHFMGSMAIHVAFGLLFFSVGTFFIMRWVKNSRREEIVYDDTKTDVFGRAKVKSITRSSLDDDTRGWAVFMMLMLSIASIITVFTW